MKKTLSPYYITVPLVAPLTGETCSSYRLELRVWNGSKSNPTTLPTYSKTVANTSNSTGEHNINISRLINDFIDFEPQTNAGTGLIDGNNQRWVKTEIYYTTSNESEASTPQNVELDIFAKGYTYGNEGMNQLTPTNKNLISGTEFNVSRTGVFVVPIEIDDEAVSTPQLVITNVTLLSGNTWTVEFTHVGDYSNLVASQDPTIGNAIGTMIQPVISPTTIESFTGQDVDIQLFGFDNSSATNITSNIFTITT